MSRKTLIIITVILIGIVVGLFAAAYFFTKESGVLSEEKEPTFVFPFGRALEDIGNRLFGASGDSEEESVLPGGDRAGSAEIFQSGVLRELSTTPVAGAFATTTQNNAVSVFYVERETGHIYEVSIDTLLRSRISNTTIPGIHETLWEKNGGSLIVRYADDNNVIKSFSGTITRAAGKPEATLEGSFLEDDIAEIVASPGGTKIFTLLPFGKSIIGALARFDNKKDKEEVLTTAYPEWLPLWPSDEVITLTTKASGDAEGSLYFLNIKTKAFNKVLSGVSGLTTLSSPRAKYILYSESKNNIFATYVYNVEKRESLSFPLITFPEKCVWSRVDPVVIYCGVPKTIPQGLYPDSWYQGHVSFSDSMWKINVETGAVDILVNLSKDGGQDIDIINPFIDGSENYLIFTNKNNRTLWSLKIAP